MESGGEIGPVVFQHNGDSMQYVQHKFNSKTKGRCCSDNFGINRGR